MSEREKSPFLLAATNFKCPSVSESRAGEIYQGTDRGRHLGLEPPALAGKGKKFSERFSSILRN